MIDPIEARFGALIASLNPSARARLARLIASQLKKTQAARIAAQQNPDGSAFEPRKPQLRHQKKNLRAGMFNKLRTGTYLKSSANADGAVIKFSRDVQRIAKVHQEGLRDKVNKTGLEATYPARQLLGITATEETLLLPLITNHLAQFL